MIDPVVTTIFIGLFVGFVLAITGAGGAILSLPLLMFLLEVKLVDAAPISLMAISLSSGFAAILGLREGIVRYKAASLLAIFGILSAPVGVFVAYQLSEKVLSILFSIVLITISIRSFQKYRTPSLLTGDELNGCLDGRGELKVEPACGVNPATSKLFWSAACTKRLIFTGGFSGFISGLLGVGGGFIIVPTLHSISNLETKVIVATSLAVIALVSTASTLFYSGSGTILWEIAIPFVTASVFGMFLGRFLHNKIPGYISLLSFIFLSALLAILMLLKTFVGF